jgi:hypothetical protein
MPHAQEVAGSPRVRRPRVPVADVDGEEFEEASKAGSLPQQLTPVPPTEWDIKFLRCWITAMHGAPAPPHVQASARELLPLQGLRGPLEPKSGAAEPKNSRPTAKGS